MLTSMFLTTMIFTVNVFTDIVLMLGLPMGKLSYNDKPHADAVAGLPVPALCRTAELVRSTRLQTFLTVLIFHSM